MLAKTPDETALARGREQIETLLQPSGVRINPPDPKPWDLQVHNPALYARVLHGGMPAFCNAYVDGWWDCEAVDELFTRLAKHLAPETLPWRMQLPEIKIRLLSRLINMQSTKRAFMVGERHYNIGNDLFKPMLGETMAYSCSYRANNPLTLDEAQIAKFDLICRKMALEPGMFVADIGCGWGGLMAHMVEHYGVRAVGITVSQEQRAFALERYAHLAETGNYRIELLDYRHLPDRYGHSFDRIVSVGMFEHVGHKNHRPYFRTAEECLRSDGLMLLHSIGGSGWPNAWIHESVFPNGELPSEIQVTKALRGIFTIRDWHNFGQDYDATLMDWDARCRAAEATLSATNPKYDERFWRFWHLYLLMCAGGFRSGRTHLWQLVLSKPGEHVGYRSVR